MPHSILDISLYFTVLAEEGLYARAFWKNSSCRIFTDCAFSYYAPRIWNQLSAHIRNAYPLPSLNNFWNSIIMNLPKWFCFFVLMCLSYKFSLVQVLHFVQRVALLAWTQIMHAFRLSQGKHVAMISCTYRAEWSYQTQGYNDSPSKHDLQNGHHAHSVTWRSKRDPISPFKFLNWSKHINPFSRCIIHGNWCWYSFIPLCQ